MVGGLTNTEVIDDHQLLHQPEMRGCGKNPMDCFRHPQFGLYFRPLLGASFSVGENLHGLKPFAFHVENLILHGVVTLLAGWFFLLLFQNKTPALIALMIFALHPLQVTATTFIGGRTDNILLFFLFWFAIGAIKSGEGGGKAGWVAISVLGYLGALFAKEQCLLAPILYPCLMRIGQSEAEISSRKDERQQTSESKRMGWVPGLSLCLASLAFYIFCAMRVIPKNAVDTISWRATEKGIVWTPLFHLEMVLRSAWAYFRLYLFPTPGTLHASSLGAWEPSQPLVCFAGILVLAAASGTTWATRKNPAAFALCLWTVLTILPCLNIVPIPSQFFACYRGVLPLVGLSGLIGLFLSKFVSFDALETKKRFASWAIIVGLGAVLSALTLLDVPAWKNDLQIGLAESAADPNFTPSIAGVGGSLQKEGKYQEAIQWYSRAAETYFPGTHTSEERIVQLGTSGLRRRMKSHSSLRWRISELVNGAFRGRGGCKQGLGDYAGAIEDYRVAAAFNPDDEEVFSAWVNCDLIMSKWKEAEVPMQKLLDRGKTGTRLNTSGYILMKQERWDEALRTLEEALKATPEGRTEERGIIIKNQLYAMAHKN